MKNRAFICGILIVLNVFMFGCKQTDVIGNTAMTSFAALFESDQITSNAKEDEGKFLIRQNNDLGGWELIAPDKSASFVWSYDYSKSTPYDVMIMADAEPFIEAGLDVNKLPKGVYSENKLVFGRSLGEYPTSHKDGATPINSFEMIVANSRDIIGYHNELDHFNVDLGNGNMFEWAKDMYANDKDIVFALNPQVLIDAGVDPNAVEGWVFTKVNMMDDDGKPVEVDKFLKPFNI